MKTKRKSLAQIAFEAWDKHWNRYAESPLTQWPTPNELCNNAMKKAARAVEREVLKRVRQRDEADLTVAYMAGLERGKDKKK